MGAPKDSQCETTDETEAIAQEKESRRHHSSEVEKPHSPKKSSRREHSSPRRHRSRSRSASKDHKQKSRSRSRSTDGHTKKSKSSSEAKQRSSTPTSRSRKRDGQESRTRSRSTPRGSHEKHSDEKTADGEKDTLRRRRSSKERTRKSSYLKSPSSEKHQKELSENRKSSVLGSLHAFLEEGKEAAPLSDKDLGDRSVVSSASRIRRMKRTGSMPSGSASVYGGYTTSREEVRQRRRSRSISATPATEEDADKVTERRRQLRKQGSTTSVSKTRSRSRSVRSRPKSLSDSQDLSAKSSQPSDRPPDIASAASKANRRMSMTSSNGAEVPPGFPMAAVDKGVAGSAPEDTEESMGMSSPSVLESTAKIRERLQRRASNPNFDTSASSLGAEATNMRKFRRRQSADLTRDIAVSPGVLRRQASVPASAPNTPSSLSSDERLGSSLTTKLERIGSRSASRPADAATAPISGDRERKRSSSTKRGHDSKSRKDSKSRSSSSKPSKSSSEGKIRERVPSAGDLNASVASLDPSVLSQLPEPTNRISSIAELYGNIENDIGGQTIDCSARSDTSDLAKPEVSTPGSLSKPGLSADVGRGSPGSLRSLSPHNSAMSTGSASDGSKSPGVLRRQSGQHAVESPNPNKRVTWLELPWNNPETLVIKSTDSEGKDERETSATADVVSKVDDLADDRKIAEAAKSIEDDQEAAKKKKSKSKPKPKKNPSLDAALKKDKRGHKKGSRDERTVGTTATSNTNTSESTFKTNNRSETPVPSKSTPSLSEGVNQNSITAADLPDLDHTGSSSSLSRAGNRSKELGSDGSSSSLTRRRKDDDKKKRTKASSTSSSSTKDRHHHRSESDKLRGHRSKAETKEKEDPATPAAEPRKAGSRIKYARRMSTTPDSQASGEPTTEKGRGLLRTGSSENESIEDIGEKLRRKSYLNRRNLMREASKTDQSSVKHSLDNFLARLDNDADLKEEKDENRSVFSDGPQKDRKSRLREKRREADDDRSVTSAPALNSNRARRATLAKINDKADRRGAGITSRLKRLDVAF